MVSLSLSVRNEAPEATAPEGHATNGRHTLGLAHHLLNSLFLDFSRIVYILKQRGRSENYTIFFSSCFHLGQIHAYTKVKDPYGFYSNYCLIFLKGNIVYL